MCGQILRGVRELDLIGLVAGKDNEKKQKAENKWGRGETTSKQEERQWKETGIKVPQKECSSPFLSSKHGLPRKAFTASRSRVTWPIEKGLHTRAKRGKAENKTLKLERQTEELEGSQGAIPLGIKYARRLHLYFKHFFKLDFRFKAFSKFSFFPPGLHQQQSQCLPTSSPHCPCKLWKWILLGAWAASIILRLPSMMPHLLATKTFFYATLLCPVFGDRGLQKFLSLQGSL